MSNSHIKKEEELHFTKKFLKEINISFIDKDLIAIPAGDGPDFKFNINKTIGLEVTSYQQLDGGNKGSIRKGTETEWFDIRYELSNKSRDSGLSNLAIIIIINRIKGISLLQIVNLKAIS